MATLYECPNSSCSEYQRAYDSYGTCPQCGTTRVSVMTKLKEFDMGRFRNGSKFNDNERERDY